MLDSARTPTCIMTLLTSPKSYSSNTCIDNTPLQMAIAISMPSHNSSVSSKIPTSQFVLSALLLLCISSIPLLPIYHHSNTTHQ